MTGKAKRLGSLSPRVCVEPAARRECSDRLRGQRTEIEGAIFERVRVVSGASDFLDPEYAQGFRAAVSAAVDWGLSSIEVGQERVLPTPPPVLIQARLAARIGIGIDVVLRRCFAGYSIFGDFLLDALEAAGLRGAELQQVLSEQATSFDRLVVSVSAEHAREAVVRLDSPEKRRAARIERLLDGEDLDTAEFGYDFHGCHVGAIAVGQGAEKMTRALAAELDRTVLLVRRDDGKVWAWLGGRDAPDRPALEKSIRSSGSAGVSFALGEPSHGYAGWRLSHRQAKAAMPIALRSPEPVVHYGDVALLVSILRDDLLAASLRDLYLVPLSRERDGGEVFRQTLRAYFSAEGNVSSAAAAVGVTRQTIINRLQAIEDRLGRRLSSCGAEIDAVLRLNELGCSLPPEVGSGSAEKV